MSDDWATVRIRYYRALGLGPARITKLSKLELRVVEHAGCAGEEYD